MITKNDVQFGFLFLVNEKIDRVVSFDGSLINGVPIEEVKPIQIENWIMDDILKLKYYNGWFFKDVLIYKEKGGWFLQISGQDVVDVQLKYIHEVQSIIYSLYKKLV